MLDAFSFLGGNSLAQVTSEGGSPVLNGGQKLAELLQGLSRMSVQVSTSDVPWSVLMIAGVSVAGALLLLLLLFRSKSRRGRRRHSRFH